MDDSQIALYVCVNYEKETRQVLEQLDASNVILHFLGHKSGCFPMTDNEIDRLTNIGESRRRSIIIGGSCITPLLDIPLKQIEVIHPKHCFSMFCDSSLIDQWTEEGAYIVTPGWLKNWKQELKKMGVNQDNHHLIFSDSLKKIVLIETHTDPKTLSLLNEFSQFVTLPAEIYNAGIGYYKLYISSLLKNTRQKQDHYRLKSKYSKLSQRYSELQLANDMMLQLTKITDPQQVIFKILEIFKTITAAETLIYIPNPPDFNKMVTFPNSGKLDNSAIPDLINRFPENLNIFEDNLHLLLRFVSAGASLGIMIITGFPFPANIHHYTEIARAILPLCALAILNINRFEKINRKNNQQNLLNKIMEMLMAANDEADEIHTILNYLKEYSRVEAIAIRIEKNEKYSYYDTIGFPDEFIHMENDIEDYCLNESVEKPMQCFCGSVLSGNIDSSLPFYTDNGSFWLGDADDLAAAHFSKLGIVIRGKCIDSGYNTIILTPLRSRNKIFGLIQFNDHRKNYFEKEDVLFFEKVGNTIGIALNKKQLREKLKFARQKAEEANRSKSLFLANMSHEIRTPLNAIIGFNSLMATMPLQPKQSGYLKSVNTAAYNLLTLINDILDLSKIESGALEFHYDFFSIRETISEIESVFQSLAINKALEIIVYIDHELPDIIYLDQVRIRQILLNLVGNAVKFTSSGFVKISAAVLRTCEADQTCFDMNLSVEDSGIGVPESELESIFEDFRQQKNQDNRVYGGTGLGLSIVKRLTKGMNGTIYVESTVGKGSKFSLTLRNVQSGETESFQQKVELVNIQNLEFSSQRVLIVDDIASNREILKECLHNVNIITDEAADGKAGLEKVATFKPDLILLDIRMPVMDGYQMINTLKAHKTAKTIPVIAMTASVSKDKQTMLMEYGFHSYLTKPLDINLLLQEIYFLFSDNVKIKSHRPSLKNGSGAEDPTVPEIQNAPEIFIQELKDKLLPAVPESNGAILVDQVSDLASDLKQLCTRFNISAFDNIIEQLQTAANTFDMETIGSLLKILKKSMTGIILPKEEE